MSSNDKIASQDKKGKQPARMTDETVSSAEPQANGREMPTVADELGNQLSALSVSVSVQTE